MKMVSATVDDLIVEFVGWELLLGSSYHPSRDQDEVSPTVEKGYSQKLASEVISISLGSGRPSQARSLADACDVWPLLLTVQAIPKQSFEDADHLRIKRAKFCDPSKGNVPANEERAQKVALRHALRQDNLKGQCHIEIPGIGI